jgi:hypothetical protein
MASSRFARAATAISGDSGSLPRFGCASDVAESTIRDEQRQMSAQFGELSLDLVKAATGHFDAQSIRKFAWCNKALSVHFYAPASCQFSNRQVMPHRPCSDYYMSIQSSFPRAQETQFNAEYNEATRIHILQLPRTA